MNNILKKLLPIIVILGSVLVAVILVKSKSSVETEPAKTTAKLIRVAKLESKTVQMNVRAQGTVVPRTESKLVSQVAGAVIWVSPAFEAGGYFKKGEMLIKIDKSDYELALTQSALQVAQAELRLQIEEQEGKIAREEYERLNEGEVPALVAREPQLAEAKAALKAAKAGMSKAQLNLDRTKIKAPYSGRVRHKNIDVGQYISPGAPAATIYSVDYAEIRLPIPDEKLKYLNIPLNFHNNSSNSKKIEVIIKADFAGKELQWSGEIIRIEGEVDSRTRMIHAVARVKDPYGVMEKSDAPPLTVGMFVTAEIIGKTIENIVEIPRLALRNEAQVMVVDAENCLRFRDVEILRIQNDKVFVSSGLAEGETICVSPLQAVVDGMKVSLYEEN